MDVFRIAIAIVAFSILGCSIYMDVRAFHEGGSIESSLLTGFSMVGIRIGMYSGYKKSIKESTQESTKE